jgi:UTP-glucose-1-phosphate uridylyltransferase/mevalonate kinase
MSIKDIDVFVPGRICLFGEHSDWAGGYRRVNSSIEPGYCIISGTSQGLHARIDSNPARFIFRSRDSSGERQTLDEPMECQRLLSIADGGGYWSYAAGVAYQALTHYHVGGIEIDNYSSDLPVKKGLSSSAATCVLVARAFNKIYDLKLTLRGEMDLAYRGEITTPSRCGRMDQGCAYGNKPILMRFDGDALDIDELSVGADLHLVIVDLRGHKNTIKILASLNKAYPFAETEAATAAQDYLGRENAALVESARVAIAEGDARKIGTLMREAQQGFDRSLAPLCPDELSSPILHGLLGEPSIQDMIWGGKGVGSQGDGSAQFVARGETERKELIAVLEKMGFGALPLTIPKSRKVHKAVITAAGYGTRLFPMTSIVRKEFLPVVDPRGRMLPLILANVEEAFDAGIEEIAIIIQEGDKKLFEDFFHQTIPQEHYWALSGPARAESERIRECGQRIVLIPQPEQRGLGHAVALARNWVGPEPFLLMLGDHLFVPKGQLRCAKQLVDRFYETEANLIGIQGTAETEIGRFGAVGGEWISTESGEKRDLLTITRFKEKPDIEYAREYLAVEGLPPGSYFTVFGLYILGPGILEELERRSSLAGQTGEIQLTDALEYMRSKEEFLGLVMDGEKVDIGVPRGYVAGLNLYTGGAFSSGPEIS